MEKLNLNNMNIKFLSTIIKGSSETTREAFIQWFIGFTEGNGCFHVGENVSFEILQDQEILNYIKEQLGLGQVYKQNSSGQVTYRYIVSDPQEIAEIIDLFNGKVQLSKKQAQFYGFVGAYNVKYNKNIIIKPHEDLTGLDKAWLSGFIDSEGCFTVSIIKQSAQRKKCSDSSKVCNLSKGCNPNIKQISGILGWNRN